MYLDDESAPHQKVRADDVAGAIRAAGEVRDELLVRVTDAAQQIAQHDHAGDEEYDEGDAASRGRQALRRFHYARELSTAPAPPVLRCGPYSGG